MELNDRLLINYMMSDFSSSQFVSESAFEYLLGEVLALDDTEQDSDVSKGTDRLDNMGYDVGYRVVESISSKLPFIGLDPLDRIKFLCKDFWIMVSRPCPITCSHHEVVYSQ